jgi:hypothetical protein
VFYSCTQHEYVGRGISNFVPHICKHRFSDEVLNNQPQSAAIIVGMRGEIGLANHTARTSHSSIVGPRKEKAGVETHVVGVKGA